MSYAELERHEWIKLIKRHAMDRKINEPEKYLKKVMPLTYKALQGWFVAELDRRKQAHVGSCRPSLNWDYDVAKNRVNGFSVEIVKHLNLPTDIKKSMDKGVRWRIDNESPEKALEWGLSRISWVNKALSVLPESYVMLTTEKKRKRIAIEMASRCAKWVTLGVKRKCEAIEIVEIINEHVGYAWLDVYPVRPKEGQEQSGQLEKIIYFLSDIQSDKFWLRKINYKFMLACENARRACGMVSENVSPYASYTARAIIRSRNKAQMQWLKDSVVCSDNGQVMNMEDIWKSSLSNPEIRRAELMTRIGGLERYSQKEGHKAVFITMTAPSRFHRLKKRGNRFIDNKNWDGSDAKAAQEWLKLSWARFRAWCKDNGVVFYGLRVVEPHIDGTPHWHGVFFMTEENRKLFTKALRAYQMQRDSEELFWFESKKGKALAKPKLKTKAAKARVDIKPIQTAKGSAVGYIAKYISKNIDGYQLEGHSSDEAKSVDIKGSVDAVTAWARINRFRQFQFIGGGSATVWRELRRIDAPIASNDRFEEIRLTTGIKGDEESKADYEAFFRANLAGFVKPSYVKYTDIETGRERVKLYGLKCESYSDVPDLDSVSDEELFNGTGKWFNESLDVCTRSVKWLLKKRSAASSLGLVSITIDERSDSVVIPIETVPI